MPGVVMENGSGTYTGGTRTNHDRDSQRNGINGATRTEEHVQDKGKGKAAPQSDTNMTTRDEANGMASGATTREIAGIEKASGNVAGSSSSQHPPPEIAHITDGYFPLSKLLIRQTQKSHVALTAKIEELAAMPMPISAVNGNASHQPNGVEDTSAENVDKKVALLNFAQKQHEEWVKVLVLTQWSRRSADVSKLIDLRVHLMKQKTLYDTAIWEMSELKRGLGQARLPNPDIKTALEVLSTGRTNWMSELDYSEPPPLTPQELLKALHHLNTILSIRLNLHEYDKIPFHFRKYTITSGRVTFRVEGEFEVDLTIADDDPDKQFWFIDFRLLFLPAPLELGENLRYRIEHKVNTILASTGLLGCYKFLHEFVLTHKISEFRRQANDMSRGLWVDSVKVEPLRRSLCIQYWCERSGEKGVKSWIIIGVQSGKPKDDRLVAKSTSKIGIRWFRDAKEVKDAEIPLELGVISTVSLLKSVIARHIVHILSTTYSSLLLRPLYSKNELSVSLMTSLTEPLECQLNIQSTPRQVIILTMEYVTGRFSIGPISRPTQLAEGRLNMQSKDVIQDASQILDTMRCSLVSDEISMRAVSAGWTRTRNPGLTAEDIKIILPKDTIQVCWFKRFGWTGQWHLAVSIGMSGESWWLLELNPLRLGGNPNAASSITTAAKLTTRIQIPVNVSTPNPTYHFLSALHLFAAALISHSTNLRALHRARAPHMLRTSNFGSMLSPLQVPAIYIKLSKLISWRPSKIWKKDVLKLTFQGVEIERQKVLMKPAEIASDPETQHVQAVSSQSTSNAAISQDRSQPPSQSQSDSKLSQAIASQPTASDVTSQVEEKAVMITEARILAPLPPYINLLPSGADHDIAYHSASGTFAFRIRSQVGASAIPTLIQRVESVERLVNFVNVVGKFSDTLRCESASLLSMVFTYGHEPTASVTTSATTFAHSKPNNPSKPVPVHRVLIEFDTPPSAMTKPTGDTAAASKSGDDDLPLTIRFEPGNPHIRILDSLSLILNSSRGLTGVAELLGPTLPALAALDAIERSWSPFTTRGEVVVLTRGVVWFSLRYLVPTPSASATRQPQQAQQQQQQQQQLAGVLPSSMSITRIVIDVRLQRRGTEPWWLVRRVGQRPDGGDEVDRLLAREVWSGCGADGEWRGMLVSAVGRATDAGVGTVLTRLDEAMREWVARLHGDGARIVASGAGAGAGAEASAGAPGQMPVKNEVVVLD